ncbi:MAG TPA: hypothetical protein PK926_11375 [Spirochaetota bacterium]|nr:hypothetical protein [Spirochaetota bacterium]HPI89100.1 hypothetical protein [Spirochaetota bacterium]HPR48854.1 hypothetical protein [Spirochaetota bacterium]
MEFVEEKTPAGYLLKIFFKNWQFLAFGKKGQTIYSDDEKKSMLHRVPLIVFVGENFVLNKSYSRNYELLKIRNGTMILPFRDRREKRNKFVFIITELPIDIIPVRIDSTKNIASMVKEMEPAIKPDYVIIDETVSANDVVIIKNRYRVDNIIYIEDTPHYKLTEMAITPDQETEVNINVLSQNPVFLTKIHLKAMNLSKINQLLLDFELTALDTEYIMNFITATMMDKKNPVSEKNRLILEDLYNSFQFYHYLLKRDNEKIKEMIQSKTNKKNFTTFRTLVLKVKSQYPGSEEQLLYTEYDNQLLEKSEEFQKV